MVYKISKCEAKYEELMKFKRSLLKDIKAKMDERSRK